MSELKGVDFVKIESSIWVANKTVNIPSYDFKFEPLFHISRPRVEYNVNLIARIGAIIDYSKLFKTFLDYGYNLINTPQQHLLASELEYWYPHIQHLTPKSEVYENFPAIDELKSKFEFPIFIKGNRQTAKHNLSLSIARTENEYKKIKKEYKNNPILHWQKIVIREFIELKKMNYNVSDKVQISYEFRTFWWKNELVGTGNYWSQYLDYNWSSDEKKAAIKLAKTAVQLLNIPFVAIDLALTKDDNWIIIPIKF